MDALKDALALWASGVAIVAAREDTVLHAVTVTAFSAVSVDPPIVLVCLGRNASVLPALQEQAPFGVSILAENQKRTASMFTDPAPIGREVFASGSVVPLVRDALATFSCTVRERIDAGDHIIVLGNVREVEVKSEDRPLLRFARKWAALVPLMLLTALPLRAQEHVHANSDTALPQQPAQAAYAAIREIIQMLKADPSTDWSRVDITALRDHLVDMDEVTMRASVQEREIPGGVELTIDGNGRAGAAALRMVREHMKVLDAGPEYATTFTETRGGAVATVTARDATDRNVAMIRALGFAGLMTESDHHAAHHLALARGDAAPHTAH